MRKKSAKKAATIGDSEQFTVPAAAGDLAARQDLTPASGSTSTLETTVDSEPPQKIPMNRAAFLLGLYVELPAVDAIVEPLVQLSVMLSIPKLLLLDSALARLGEYDAERSSFPDQGSFGQSRLDPADGRRRSTVEFLYFTERAKVGTIADLLWEGQTELAAWYQVGKAIGNLILTSVRSDLRPAPQAVLFAQSCLKEAASFWGGVTTAENGSGLGQWILQWDGQFGAGGSAAGKDETRKLEHRQAQPCERELRELRAVEVLAAQIQDRQEDPRPENQRLRDDRDQFIYELFFAGYDASQVRELTNRRIVDEGLKWLKVPSKTDVRAIAVQYALRLKKPTLPAAQAGRPRRTIRK